MIVKHPVTDRPTPVMAIKFIHYKGSDNRPKPYVHLLVSLSTMRPRYTLCVSPTLTQTRTIFFFTPTKKLIFCPVSIIVGLALHDEAFHATSLTDAKRVLDVKTWGFMKSTPLCWKKSKLKMPLFRRIDRDGGLSATEAMAYSKLRYDMVQQSQDAGYKQYWTPRFFCRGAGNAANGKSPIAVVVSLGLHS